MIEIISLIVLIIIVLFIKYSLLAFILGTILFILGLTLTFWKLTAMVILLDMFVTLLTGGNSNGK